MAAPSITPQTLRTVIAAGSIALVLFLTQSGDILIDVTRPLVIACLDWMGVAAMDQGSMISIGRLEVPWTRDCAGINLLVILLALTIWVNRYEKSQTHFWLRLAFALPAALLANVARVLTLIGYRAFFYPVIESPQTHYFMGLIWLVPFVTWIIPRNERRLSHGWLEALHAAAVVALLAPMAGTPNGSLVLLCAVIALAHCQMRRDHLQLRLWLTVLWLTGGAAIAVINMESFWLPWLLLCPLLADFRWLSKVSGILVLSCTHAVIAMHPWAVFVGGAGLIMTLIPWLKNTPHFSSEEAVPATSSLVWRNTLHCLCLAAFAWPFTSSALLTFGYQKWTPPTNVESRFIGNDGYEIRLEGQPDEVGLVCYAAPGRDRHHTVQVCLKYRGVEITQVPGRDAVFSDGSHWLREFFLQNDTLQTDYAGYLSATFRPWADPGIHLIFVAPQDQISAAEFESHCTRLAQAFHTLDRQNNSHSRPTTLALQP